MKKLKSIIFYIDYGLLEVARHSVAVGETIS
jgi:hypothetical protein